MNIRGSSAVFAVLGDPVTHSLSPAIHNRWIADANLDAVYVALRIARNDAAPLIRSLPSAGLSGANVTIPHKEASLLAADWRDDLASRIGAANTLRFKNGRIEAFNTDASGFMMALDAATPDWRGDARRACLLGAGGSARAIVAALDLAGFSEIAIANRTETRIKGLTGCAEKARIIPYAWENRDAAAAGASLIVNATSLGLNDVDRFDAPIETAAANAIAFDLVYKPLETQFLKTAAAKGARAVDGLGMLIYQAAAAFELWFGIKPNIENGRAAALAQLTAKP
ncbi:MAG: shikimate dehydrogenase [Caulobacterales bacterium]